MPLQDSTHEEKIRVLIVEDEESFLDVLTKILQSTDRFTVVPFQTGEDALGALTTSRFDVVILDLKLPGMSGLNVLQWIHEQKLDTPVIVLTGTGSEFIAAETMKYGAYDYIAKDNFDKDRFPKIVSAVVDQHLSKIGRTETREDGAGTELGSLEILSNSISSLAHAANTAMVTVKLMTEECQATLQPLLTPEGKAQLRNSTEAIKKEHEVIIAVTRSILELSKAMYNKYENIQTAKTPAKGLPVTKEKENKDSQITGRNKP